MTSAFHPPFNWISDSPAATEWFGELLGGRLRPDDVITLDGSLGAGKTALTRGMARGWGSVDRVTSPTYTLVNQYQRPEDNLLFYHLDCYRLRSSNEAETIGLDDILGAGGIVVIEWAAVVEDWLPADRLAIVLDTPEPLSRSLTLRAGGPRSAVLLNDIRGLIPHNQLDAA